MGRAGQHARCPAANAAAVARANAALSRLVSSSEASGRIRRRGSATRGCRWLCSGGVHIRHAGSHLRVSGASAAIGIAASGRGDCDRGSRRLGPRGRCARFRLAPPGGALVRTSVEIGRKKKSEASVRRVGRVAFFAVLLDASRDPQLAQWNGQQVWRHAELARQGAHPERFVRFGQCLHDALTQLGSVRLRLALCLCASAPRAACSRRIVSRSAADRRRVAFRRREGGNVGKRCIANYLNEPSDKLGRQVRQLSFKGCPGHRARSLASFGNRAKAVFPAALACSPPMRGAGNAARKKAETLEVPARRHARLAFIRTCT